MLRLSARARLRAALSRRPHIGIAQHAPSPRLLPAPSRGARALSLYHGEIVAQRSVAAGGDGVTIVKAAA